MYLLDVSIRDLKYFCVLFVLFVFLFMLLALLRCYTSIFDGFICILELVSILMSMINGCIVPDEYLNSGREPSGHYNLKLVVSKRFTSLMPSLTMNRQSLLI